MVLIARELVKHEKILEFTGTYEDYLRKDTKSPFWLVNTNRLVRFYSGVDGLKTGFTDEAGYCLTSTAKRDNMRLITVVMNEPDISKRSADTSKMLDYGFNVYMVRNIIDDSSIIDKVKVELGKNTEAEIIANDKITVLSKKSEEKRRREKDEREREGKEGIIELKTVRELKMALGSEVEINSAII